MYPFKNSGSGCNNIWSYVAARFVQVRYFNLTQLKSVFLHSHILSEEIGVSVGIQEAKMGYV